MKVRWSAAAAHDLEAAANYLFEKTPSNAAQLVRKIFDASSSLKTFPNRGESAK
jgi:plasmid stabilization system protein ParE